MENPCKLVCFGDSIAKAYTPLFESRLLERFPDHRLTVVNAGVVSDTTRQGIVRLEAIGELHPTVCLVGFGMNDWRKGVGPVEFRANLSRIVATLSSAGIRTLLLTITPNNDESDQISPEIQIYNREILKVARVHRLRVVDLYQAFIEKIIPVAAGLYDDIHPNHQGDRAIVDELLDIVPLRQTIVVWTFNGEHCFCNYACPYCYVPAETNNGHAFRGDPERWRRALKASFGDEELVFYFSFGEPMAGRGFYRLLAMIASEPRWSVHITSNLSLPLDKLLRTTLVREGRFHINASFHPSQVAFDAFMDKLLTLREHGVEASVVYVMYPPQLKAFQDYFDALHGHGFFVHVRRFRGEFNGRTYPQAYSPEERRFIARYCDRLTVKYMLNDMEEKAAETAARLSYAGMHYLMLDQDGEVWPSPDHKGTSSLGNLLAGSFRLHMRLKPYGGIILGSVNIIASLKETGMRPLEGNHTWSFAQSGGCRRLPDGKVHYPLMTADLDDPALCGELNWPKGG